MSLNITWKNGYFEGYTSDIFQKTHQDYEPSMVGFPRNFLQKLGGGFSSRKAFSGFDWHERKSAKILKVEMYRFPKFTSFGNSSNDMDDSCVLFFGPPIRLKHWWGLSIQAFHHSKLTNMKLGALQVYNSANLSNGKWTMNKLRCISY